MPNTKSAIKAARQNLSHRKINLLQLDKVRKAIKAVRKSATAGKADDASKALSQAFAALDKAAKKNIIHKNTAARRKSRLALMVAKSSKK
jgi:small subunit ribosomal protein S20